MEREERIVLREEFRRLQIEREEKRVPGRRVPENTD